MFVPILIVVFNNLFYQGFAHDRISRGVITLLKKGKHVGEELDNSRHITLLNTVNFCEDPDGVFADR